MSQLVRSGQGEGLGLPEKTLTDPLQEIKALEQASEVLCLSFVPSLALSLAPTIKTDDPIHAVSRSSAPAVRA